MSRRPFLTDVSKCPGRCSTKQVRPYLWAGSGYRCVQGFAAYLLSVTLCRSPVTSGASEASEAVAPSAPAPGGHPPLAVGGPESVVAPLRMAGVVRAGRVPFSVSHAAL